jgi:2-desacetyl-2-hydroxyethyl bacteriochlorophyllide A dehydrogenase
MIANAVVFTAPLTVEFKEIECPNPGPEDVLVRVLHSWISNGTEGSYLRGERIAGDTPYRPGDPWPFPVVSGYQKIGVVEWVGDAVHDIEAGEMVFAAFGKVSGLFEPFGGQVSPSVCPRDMIWRLPGGVDPLAFAGLVLTQVGYNAGTRGPIEIGEGAVVVGDGLVGQWTAQTLAWRGAQTVLVGRHNDRLARFTGRPGRLGVNASNTDWLNALADLFPDGVRYAVDTVGDRSVLEGLYTCLQRFGRLVSAGFYGIDDRVALQPLRYKELSVELVSGWVTDRMNRTRELIANGNLETLPLITHRFPAREAARAWKLIETKTEPVLGVILDWES